MRHAPAKACPIEQAGFSLIEVLMALAILSIAAVASLSLMQSSTRETHHMQERALATLAVENLLHMQLINGQPLENRSGQYQLADRDYDWQMVVTPTPDADLQRLSLSVQAHGSQQVLAQIDTFRRRR